MATVTVSEVHIRRGALIDQISFVYSDGSEQHWGGQGGQESPKGVFRLRKGEFITKVIQRSGDELDMVQFVTSIGRESPKYGNERGGLLQPEMVASEGNQIFAVHRDEGRGCGAIDRVTEKPAPPQTHMEMKVSTKKGIGFYIRAATSFINGVEAQEVESDKPAITVSEVHVRHGMLIDDISFVYSDGSKQHWGFQRTKESPKGVFALRKGEFITKVIQRSVDGSPRMDMVQFVTSIGRESPKYGNEDGGSLRPEMVASEGNQIFALESEGSDIDIGSFSEKPAPKMSTAKDPVDHLSISGLGEAISVAVAVAAQCVKDGSAKIHKIETNYPDMAQGRGCAHITIELDKCT